MFALAQEASSDAGWRGLLLWDGDGDLATGAAAHFASLLASAASRDVAIVNPRRLCPITETTG